MAYRTDKACEAVDAARDRVERAQAGYSRGGSCEDVNRAQRALADAYARYREVEGSNVPDKR